MLKVRRSQGWVRPVKHLARKRAYVKGDWLSSVERASLKLEVAFLHSGFKIRTSGKIAVLFRDADPALSSINDLMIPAPGVHAVTQ